MMGKYVGPPVRMFDRIAISLMAGCIGALYLFALVPQPGTPLLDFSRSAATDPVEFVPRGVVDLSARASLPQRVKLANLEDAKAPFDAKPMAIANINKLASLFDGANYRIATGDGTKRIVPRIFLANLPKDFSTVRSPKQRKDMFLRTVLPLVLLKNDEIKQERRRLLALKARLDRGEALLPHAQGWLNELAARYRVRALDIDELVVRVDVIPPSLALAQAAKESGWGTSRFAREGNALFGQWTWGRSAGLVPTRRESGKRHTVRAFLHLLDSARAYAFNLNTHAAYRGLRALRAELRHRGQFPDGYALASQLKSYSAMGQDYVDALRAIIRVNALDRLDDAELSRTARVEPSS